MGIEHQIMAGILGDLQAAGSEKDDNGDEGGGFGVSESDERLVIFEVVAGKVRLLLLVDPT